MAIRTVEYTVSVGGISPSVKQFGGVQSEHKATEVLFNIENSLYEMITAQSDVDGAKLIYRFDGYDGEGGVCRSDTGDLTGTQVKYLLEEWITRFGGVVKVVLVISLLKDDLTEMELFSFPALLQLKNLPEGADKSGESYESMSVLAQVAKDSANTAVTSADIAVEAKEKTELAKAALEGGTVWVFDGGDASGNVDTDGDGVADVNTADVKFVVDNEMSDDSENAVKNRVIKAYVDENVSKTNDKVTTNSENIVDIQQAINIMWSKIYPIGSIYISTVSTSPAILFGGTWVQIKDTFLLAAGDTYIAGATGGEATHTLTCDEMPSHSHDRYFTNTGGAQTMEGAEGDMGILQGTCTTTSKQTTWQRMFTYRKGNDQPHNNMPPYLVVYVWTRTA